MRTLEQYREEIFRRSQRRIARRRIVLGCVPVVLVLILVLTLPMPDKNTTQTPGADGMAEEMATQTAPMTLQIRYGDQYRDITDPERIASLYQMLAKAETVGSTGTTQSPNDKMPPDNLLQPPQAPTFGAPLETLLVFHDSRNGQTFTYCLTENGCYRTETNEWIPLTPQERQELEELL